MAQIAVPLAIAGITTGITVLGPPLLEAATKAAAKFADKYRNNTPAQNTHQNYNNTQQNQNQYQHQNQNQAQPWNIPPINFYYNSKSTPPAPIRGKGPDAPSLNVDGIIENLKMQIAQSDLFKIFDKEHQSLLEADWHRGENLYHFLHFSFITFLNVRDRCDKQCQFCVVPCTTVLAELVDRSRYFFFLHRHEMKNMLASMYQCNAATVNLFFMILMAPCNPHNGMFAYDLHAIVEERVKKINQLNANKIFYHGIIYNKSTSETLFAQHAAAVLAKSAEFKRHVFLYATHTVTKPQHWCLVFIDLNCNLYIHYNSLGAHRDFNDTLYKILSSELLFPKLELLKNAHRNQGRSKLCGIFVYDMLYELSTSTSDNLRLAFEEYTNGRLAEQSQKYIDNVIADRVENYFTPGDMKSTLFTSVFNNYSE